MRRLAAAALAAAALLRPASSECNKHIRFGTFDEANPYAALAPSQWLDDDEVCWVYYRQLSGGRAVAHLDSGELDVAMLGSTPYATAIARGAALTAVAVLHNKGAAQALVVRCALHGPQDLRGTTIAAPRYSTTHYILLAALVEAGLDHVETTELPSAGAAAAADRVTVVTISPTEIEAAWSAGRIDGGAVWGNTLVNLTSADWGGSPPSGCQPEPAHEMITAEMLALWGYETLNVLAVRNAFLSRNEALVERLAAGIVRANADYRLASGRGRWAAGPGGEYNSLVSAFVALEAPGYDSNATLAQVADRVAKFEYPTAEQQLEEQSYLAAQIEKQADFMFSQKVLVSIPNASGTDSVYATYFNASFLEAALAAGAASGFDSDGPRASPLAPLQQESVLTPCAGWAVEVVNANHAPVLAPHWPPPHAGGGGGAYRTDESCVWAVAVEEPTQCVELRLPFLSSEPPRDVLEVFSSSGLLISSFTGRASPPNATVRACANSTTLAGAAAVGTALTADRDLDVSLPEAGAFLAMFLRWSTDGHDESQLGDYTAVGFRASVSLEGDTSDCPSCGPHGVADSAGGSCGCRCDAGYAGSSCELETCNGVVTLSEAEGAVRATAVGRYAAYSRCGWLLTGGGAPFVALNLSSIRLELGFDEVRVYEGGVIPASFSALASATSDDFLFSTFGSSPAATLAVRTPAFVAFTSDGVWSGSGFELAWSAQQAACETDADCSGRGSCRDGECRCDVGAFGPTCSFEKCVGLSTIEGAVAGMLQAIDDSQDDYLSSVACRWELAMPTTIESLDPPLSVTGLRLNFSLFELEEPEVTNPDLGIRSSTTDAVRVLDGDGTVLDTFSSTSNAPTMGEAIALDGPPPFTLTFDTDKNNPRPYRGFRAFFLAATKEETLCHAEHFPCTDVEKPECRLFAGEAHGYCTAKSSPPTSALLPASLAATFAVLLLIGGLCCVVQRRRRRRLKGIIEEAEREFARWEPLPEEHRGATALRAQLTESIERAADRVRSSLSFRGTDVGDSRPGSGNTSPAARGVWSLPKRQRPRVVSAVGLPEERYHCFLSHVWSSGQDQARALKGQLQRYVQNIQPFLDVDNLDDTARLEEHVGNSEVVIVLLTGSTPARSCPSSPPGGARSDYFGSANCLRELHAAVARSKPLLLVLETDPTHGGVPLEVHRSACPAELRAKVFSAPLVTWHRLRPFQMCSMRLLIVELLRAWKAPGAERPIFLPGDLCRSPPPQLATKRTWHLCYSRDNEGAAELVARLERASEQQLRATADAEQMRSSAALLLYLDGATFGGAGLPDRSKDGAASEGLVRLVRRALDDGIPMVLVHEQRSVPEAVSFDEIIRRTPAELVSAGIYRPIATSLLDEPHAAVAVRLVLNNLDLICRRIERHNSGVIGSLTALAESLTRFDMDGDGEIGNSPTRSSEHAPASAPKPRARLKWRRRTPPEKVASCV